ncbi:MAG: hypothetical protein ACK5O6_03565, partial [Betaproteobacteria bacterium]
MPISAVLWRIETDVNLDSVMKTLRSNNPQQPVDCKSFSGTFCATVGRSLPRYAAFRVSTLS